MYFFSFCSLFFLKSKSVNTSDFLPLSFFPLVYVNMRLAIKMVNMIHMDTSRMGLSE